MFSLHPSPGHSHHTIQHCQAYGFTAAGGTRPPPPPDRGRVAPPPGLLRPPPYLGGAPAAGWRRCWGCRRRRSSSITSPAVRCGAPPSPSFGPRPPQVISSDLLLHIATTVIAKKLILNFIKPNGQQDLLYLIFFKDARGNVRGVFILSFGIYRNIYSCVEGSGKTFPHMKGVTAASAPPASHPSNPL